MTVSFGSGISMPVIDGVFIGGGTLSVTSGKTFTVSNTLTLTGTDGSTLNIGTGSALSAIGALTPAADKVPYFTGASTAAITDFTSVARTLVGQTTQATMRSTGLGLDTLTQPLMDYGGMNFNGTDFWLDANALAPIADSKKGSFVWVGRFANAAGTNEELMTSTGSAFRVLKNTGGNFLISAENVGGTPILSQVTSAIPLAAAGTYAIMASWDLAVPGSYKLYINDVAPAVTSTTFTDDTIDYTVAENSIGANVAGSNKFVGDCYLLWFDPTTAQDFSSAAVRRKFTDANNVPQFLGSHGELPTGTPPILFLGYSEFQNWSRNRGISTAAFTENGTPAVKTTPLYGQAAAVDNVSKCAVRTSAVGNVTTGEDDLITYTIPANRLPARGCGVHVTAWGISANNANAKTVKLYFGSQLIMTNALTVSIAGVWRIEADILSTGVDAQDYVSQLVTTGTAGVALNDIEVGTATQDDGAAIIVKCTGEATASNDIVQEGMIVTLLGI